MIHQNIDQAAQELLQNDIVAIPTETVYGLAGNAYSETAVQKIFSAKERPSFDPLIVHVPQKWLSLSELTRRGIVSGDLLSAEMFTAISLLMQKFMPGPLTLLLPKGNRIPALVTSGRALVGIRSPNHFLAQKILEKTSLPLAAPSANRFGRTSPTTAEHVQSELTGRISSIFDGGSCEVGVESTVAILNPNLTISILRPGFVSEQMFRDLGFQISKDGSGEKVSSPGTLDQHYAPEKPLLAPQNAIEFEKLISQNPKTLVIVPDSSIERDSTWKEALTKTSSKIYLSRSESDAEAARQLFATLHAYNLNVSQQTAVVTPIIRNDGLWVAIQDRLSRASTQI